MAIYSHYYLFLLLQKYKKRRLTAATQPANSAGEAIERMLVEKKLSAKINYDVLKSLDRGLFGPLGGSPGSPGSGTTADTPGTTPDTTPGITASTTPDTTASTIPGTTPDTTASTTAGATPDTTASTIAGATVEEVTRQAIAVYEERLVARPASPLPLTLLPTTPGGAGGSLLDISHSPPHRARRLPSLQSRKRPFSPFVGGGGPTVPVPK